jgi:hypothetical protein
LRWIREIHQKPWQEASRHPKKQVVETEETPAGMCLEEKNPFNVNILKGVTGGVNLFEVGKSLYLRELR